MRLSAEEHERAFDRVRKQTLLSEPHVREAIARAIELSITKPNPNLEPVDHIVILATLELWDRERAGRPDSGAAADR